MKATDKDLVQKRKDEFRDKYQAKGSAEHLGIIAAVQRASLYTPNRNNADIRRVWENKLHSMVEKYKETTQAEITFIEDILSLKKAMNDAFPAVQRRFNNGKEGYDNEFRIAHAQKSLSICLKHLWCRGELGNNIPPLCPVDGILLKAVHNKDSWTQVNTIAEYERHISLFKEKQTAQGYENLSVWELMTWNAQGTYTKNDKLKHNRNNTLYPDVTLIKNGEKVLNRTGCALSGYKIAQEKHDLYIFIGEDTKKCYCEIITSNGKYSEKEIEVIESNTHFEHHMPRTQRAYYICTFDVSDKYKAQSLMESIKEKILKAIK